MNPVLIELGGYTLKWYTVFVIVAALLGVLLTTKEAKRFNIKSDFIFNMAFWAIIFGLIGARLYYVIFNWDYYGATLPDGSNRLLEIFKIWEGGIAIHGAIIAGFITIFFYCKKYKARLIRYIDFIVVPLLLAQGIGRWGNFFNSEAYGGPTTLANLQTWFIPKFVANGMLIEGVYRVPTFYYEFLGCLILFIIFIFIRRGKYIKVGTMSGLYLMGYGVIRFFIEMSRVDALTIAGFKMAQIVSVVMFLIGLAIITINMRKSKFEDLYNDKNNVDNLLF